MTKVSLGEFQLISKYFDIQGRRQDQNKEQKRPNSDLSSSSDQPELTLGIGDDAALIQGFGNQSLAISADTLVEGVHFPVSADPLLLAKRALRVNLSDMAAMGAIPKWFTLALTLPSVSESWLKAFSKGLHEDAAGFGCQLIGGDTTKGPLNIGIQIMGLVAEDSKPLTRSGAKPGDYLVVSGTLGDAGAALDFDLNAFKNSPNLSARTQVNSSIHSDVSEQYFLTRYWLPSPRIELANKASELINAACDISDGLLADAGHLCSRSGLSATVEQEKIPVSKDFFQLYRGDRQRAAISGDDYELCMAVSPHNIEKLNSVALSLNLTVTVVGRFFVESESNQSNAINKVSLIDAEGVEIDNKFDGYKHF